MLDNRKNYGYNVALYHAMRIYKMSYDFNIGKTNKPIVKITKRSFTFNKEAIELLGAPRYIAIGLDKSKKLLAFRKAEAKSFTEPVYPFATDFGKHKWVLVTATEVRTEAIKLLPSIPVSGGISFVLELDNNTRYGIIDLINGIN